MIARRLIFILLPVLFISCGEGKVTGFTDTVAIPTEPVITRVNPTGGQAGDEVTAIGFGFSIEPAQNVISIGGVETSATAYSLTDGSVAGEVEQMTFTVPEGVTAGENVIIIIVNGNPSNSDITFTVNQ